MRFDLAGKAALVTGGASGIGLATATMLARFGCTVAINHLPEDPRGPEAVARLSNQGHDVLAAPGNVGLPGEAERMVEAAVTRLGRLDLLVNNAGTPGGSRAVPPQELDTLTEAFWADILGTNLLGVFRCSHAAAPALKAARGAIVSTASISGISTQGSSTAYAASKAAVVNLTRCLARGLAPAVRVNAVAPGSVDSAWPIEWGEAGAGGGHREGGAETSLHARGHRRGDRLPRLRRRHGHRPDRGGGRRHDALTALSPPR